MTISNRNSKITASVGNQLRKVFLRCTSRTFTHELIIEPIAATEQRYSIKDATEILPGGREHSALPFAIMSIPATLAPTTSYSCCNLFSQSLVGSNPEASTTDGLLVAFPSVLLGSLNLEPLTTCAILPSFTNNSSVQAVSTGVMSTVKPGRNLTVIERFKPTIHRTKVAIAFHELIQRTNYSTGFCKAHVSHVSEEIQSKVPLIIRRQPFYAKNALDEHTLWKAEKKLLAVAAGNGTAEDDIQVIGVFKGVPISSASKIEIGPGPGNLSIYLRPRSGNVVQSDNRSKFSIAFGRIRGKKEILRVLIPE